MQNSFKASYEELELCNKRISIEIDKIYQET